MAYFKEKCIFLWYFDCFALSLQSNEDDILPRRNHLQ